MSLDPSRASSFRPRLSLAQMLQSPALEQWRQRMDRTEDSSSSGGGHRAQKQPRSGSPAAARSRRGDLQPGPALTLDQMRTPAKDEPSQPLRSPMRTHTRLSPTRRSPPRKHHSPSRSQQPKPASQPQSPLRHLTHPRPGQAYQYDLYPSNPQSRHEPRPSPFRGANDTATFDASLSSTAPRSHSSLDATRRLSPPSRQQAPHSTPKYTADSFDIPATQKRIRNLMEEQNQRRVESLASSASAQQAAMAANSAGAHVSPSHFPRTSALTASKGARSIAEMKRDVAFRVLDRTNPEHRLNNPVGQPANDRRASAGVFHLQHHAPSTFAECAVPSGAVGSTRLSSEFTHPLQASPDDRRIQGILGLAAASPHNSSAHFTTSQLRANNVPRSNVHEEQANARVQTPVSFFPQAAPLHPSTAAAVPSTGPPRPLPQSAYLATMHAGALRMEHLLRQPKMQVMMDALLPAHLSRDEILARPASPPHTRSNVDRLLYETITGTSQQSHPITANARNDNVAAMQHSVSPPGSDQFSRAALLQREARLGAMLALSSPDGPDAIHRMSFDPQAEERSSEEPVAERFFDTRSTLGSDAAVHEVTVSRALLADPPRCVSACVLPTSNVDVVVSDLLGSPSQRRLSMRMTNADDTRHGGGAQAVLEGHLSPLRKTMAEIPTSRGDNGQAILGATTAWAAAEQATTGSSYVQARRFAESALLSPTSHGASFASAPLFSRTGEPAPVAAAPVASVLAAGGPLSPRSLADSPDALSLAAASLGLTQSQLDYLEASTSVSTQLLQSDLHSMYDDALNRKASELLAVRDHRLCLDAWLSWRCRFTQQRECDRVLHRKRHEGDAGYRAFQQQQQQPIHDIHTAWIEQARRDNSDAPLVDSNGSAGPRMQDPSSFASSSLLHDVPQLPASTAIDAVHRRTFVAESCRFGKNELLAQLHAQTWRARRSFSAWRRWCRVERQGKLLLSASRRQCVQLWFKNWRDLMRIVRGEFHLWAQGKQHDAAQAAREAQEQREDKEDRRQRLWEQQEASRMDGESEADGTAGQPLYARASVRPLSRAAASDHATAALPLHSPTRLESQRLGRANAQSPDPHSSVLVASASALSPVSLSASVRSDSPRGLAPLSAHLASAYTRDQFSMHQEAMLHRRRNENEQRKHVDQRRAQMDTPLMAQAQTERPRQQLAGPLLFHTGSSMARPTAEASVPPSLSASLSLSLPVRSSPRANSASPSVGSRASPVSGPRSSASAAAASSSSSSSSLPFTLSSPIQTRLGQGPGPGPILHELTGIPAFDRQLMLRGSDPSGCPSPRAVRPPSLGTTAAAASPAESSAITDEELRANVRVAEETHMRRQAAQTGAQAAVAQWHIVEHEKASYREQVQQAHARKE